MRGKVYNRSFQSDMCYDRGKSKKSGMRLGQEASKRR